MDTPSSNLDETLWLGYSGLVVECAAVSAVINYQSVWDRRIIQSYGRLPAGVCCVVLLEDGRALPAQRSTDDLRRQWNAWLGTSAS